MISVLKRQNTLNYLAILSVLMIFMLSLLPASDMYRTGAPKGVEHFVAYLGTGFLINLALRGGWREQMLTSTGLAVLAGAMEMLQQLSPGRTPHVSDFIASAAGAVTGVMMAGVAFRYAAHRWGQGGAKMPRASGGGA